MNDESISKIYIICIFLIIFLLFYIFIISFFIPISSAVTVLSTESAGQVNLIICNWSISPLEINLLLDPWESSLNLSNVSVSTVRSDNKPCNGGHNFTITSDGDISSWISLNESYFYLRNNQNQSFSINVTVPDSANLGMNYGKVNISNGSEIIQIDINVNVTGNIGNISATVLSGGSLLEGANISIKNKSTQKEIVSGTTNPAGNWQSNWLPLGEYTVEASKSDYNTNSNNVTVNAGQTNYTTITLTLSEEPEGPVSPGGGGGGAAPVIILPLVECYTDNDCSSGRACVRGKCTKLFDLKIIRVDSPIIPGEFLDFIYLIKSMTDISGDVVMEFWLEKSGVRITSGSDTIYVNKYEEKIENASIYLNSDLEPGTYTFKIKLTLGNYTISSYRTIEVSYEAPQTIDLDLIGPSSVSSKEEYPLSLIVSSNRDLPIETHININITKGEKSFWSKSYDIVVERSYSLEEKIPGLSTGRYKINIHATYRGRETILSEEFSVKYPDLYYIAAFLIILILIATISIIIVIQRRKRHYRRHESFIDLVKKIVINE